MSFVSSASGTCIVHENVEPAECRNSFFDRGFADVGIRGVCLNRDRLSARAFNRFDNIRRRVGTFRAAPTPREPPVMSASFPSNFFDLLHLHEFDICSSGMSQPRCSPKASQARRLDYAVRPVVALLTHTLLSWRRMLSKHGDERWNYAIFAISSRLRTREA